MSKDHAHMLSLLNKLSFQYKTNLCTFLLVKTCSWQVKNMKVKCFYNLQCDSPRRDLSQSGRWLFTALHGSRLTQTLELYENKLFTTFILNCYCPEDSQNHKHSLVLTTSSTPEYYQKHPQFINGRYMLN